MNELIIERSHPIRGHPYLTNARWFNIVGCPQQRGGNSRGIQSVSGGRYAIKIAFPDLIYRRAGSGIPLLIGHGQKSGFRMDPEVWSSQSSSYNFHVSAIFGYVQNRTIVSGTPYKSFVGQFTDVRARI